MAHRYTKLSWWISRLSPTLEKLLPTDTFMRTLSFSARRSAEPELGLLPQWVRGDRTAVDIGAAEGVYTWCLSKLAASCWAFEANPASAAKVRRRVPNARVVETALSSDDDGVKTLFVPASKGFAQSGLGTVETSNPVIREAGAMQVEVPVSTLDAYEVASVGFIKIDVEGHELEVLKGAERTILRDRPTLLIEVEDRHRPNARASVVSWLRERGYAPPEEHSSQNLLFRPEGEMGSEEPAREG